MSHSIEIGGVAYRDNFSPTFRNHIYWILASFHFKGLKGGIYHYYHRLLGLLAGKPGSPTGYQPSFCSEQFAAAPLDNRIDDLAMHGQNAKWGVCYDPTPEALFHKIIAGLPVDWTITTLSISVQGRAGHYYWLPSTHSRVSLG